MNDIRELFKLTIEARLQLVEDLWDSIARDADKHRSVSPELQAEIEKRMAEDDADPDSAREWNDIREDLQPHAK